MNNKLIKDINLLKELNKDEEILIAVSTGIDSMCLFDFLYKEGYKLRVLHVNHKRRKESDDEYKYLKEYLNKLNVPMYYYEINESIDSNFQEEARNIRYNFFLNTAKELNIKTLVTAHQEDDLIETILYRLTRGTISDGYLGIKEVTYKDGIKIVRPLLHTSRDKIVQYQKENNVLYFEDSSNNENHYTRNKIRHNSIPILKEINPKLGASILNFRDDFKDLLDFSKKEANQFINDNISFKKTEATMNASDFIKLDRAIKKEVIKAIINKVSNDSLELTHERLDEILSLNLSKGLDIELGKDYMFSQSMNKISIYKNNNIEDVDITINNIENVENDEFIIKISQNYQLLPNKLSYLLCYNSLCDIMPIKVRRIKAGDKIRLGSINKNISDILMEEKVEKRNRSKVLVFLDNNNEIFFVPGYARKSTNENLKNKIYITVEFKNEN